MTQAPTHSDSASRNQRGITVVPLPTLRLPLAGTDARLAEERGSGTPSSQGTCTPCLLPVRLAHVAVGMRIAAHSYRDGGEGLGNDPSYPAPTQHHHACRQENTNKISMGMACPTSSIPTYPSSSGATMGRRLPRQKRLQPDPVRRRLQHAVHGFHGRQGTHRRESEVRVNREDVCAGQPAGGLVP